MIGKSLTLIMLLLLFAPVTFAGEERYLCVADKSTGFKFDETLKENHYTKLKKIAANTDIITLMTDELGGNRDE